MPAVALHDLTGAVFRANPRYKLVPFDSLPAGQREALASVRQDPDLFGILLPEAAGSLGLKSVCHDTAGLFSALAEPGPLPDRYKLGSRHELNREIAELVLDEVLEIASEGRFVCGAVAYPVIFGDEGCREGTNRLARLSIEALRHAAALEIEDAGKLSARIYFYNRLPVTPSWKRLWPDEEAVLRHLGAGRGGSRRATLAKDYISVPTSTTYAGWLAWRRRGRPPHRPKGKVAYKLYVSPLPTHVGTAFAATVATLDAVPVSYFKVGRDAYGLLRPDKIVCYFDGFDALLQFVEALKPGVAGCPAHGVPFTAPLTSDGLLSWGIDPPRDEARPAWMESESWRLWVANRLAVALVAARGGAAPALEPWRFALERLRLAGVDTETWTPSEAMWERAGAKGRE